MKFKLIVATVKPQFTDPVVSAAKSAGATGATTIGGRGTGIHEAKTFFGLTLEAQTDLLLFLLEEHLVAPVVEAISKAGEFKKPGTGILFVLPIDQVAGLDSQMEIFRKCTRDDEKNDTD